ncbi:MAG: hypothetical protein RLN86_12930 [Cyclobacteriaceae bacterium]
MYKDIISYELAEGISEEHLLTVAKQIVKSWMKKQVGFIKWEIHTSGDKGYTDIVHWKTKEDAKNSEKDMVNIPNAGDWYACYKQGSISSKNLTTVASF